MYQIPINAESFHVNEFSEQEKQWARRACERVLKKNAKLARFVEHELKPLGYGAEENQALLTEITLGFCHAMQVSNPPQSEERMCGILKKWMFSFLPYLVKNLCVMRLSHPIQFEPIAVANLYVSQTLLEGLTSTDLNACESEYEQCILLDFIAMFRAARSAMVLLSVGDDVHAVGLLRGMLEIMARLTLSARFPEEYVRFKHFNVHLQAQKFEKKPLPAEMTDYLADCAEYKSNSENFLAYGWARDPHGRRILTMRKFIREGLQNPNLDEWLQLAGEFVHEDYSLVNYDYIGLCKKVTDLLFLLFDMVFKETELTAILPKKLCGRARHLLRMSADIYTGEVPLSNVIS